MKRGRGAGGAVDGECEGCEGEADAVQQHVMRLAHDAGGHQDLARVCLGGGLRLKQDVILKNAGGWGGERVGVSDVPRKWRNKQDLSSI